MFVNKQASSMADVLNHLYRQVDAMRADVDDPPQADVDDPHPLSPESRVVLHSVIGSPPYFAAIFLPFFYEDATPQTCLRQAFDRVPLQRFLFLRWLKQGAIHLS